MSSSSAVVMAIVVLLAGTLLYFAVIADAGRTNSSASSSTSESTIKGVVTGLVTVGPSTPVCTQNQSCTVDLSGYGLVFRQGCGTTQCQEQNFTAPIAPSGHYSILLAPGNYTITGLSPSCDWLGCSSSFPKAVVVEGGQQVVVDVEIDTGIR